MTHQMPISITLYLTIYSITLLSQTKDFLGTGDRTPIIGVGQTANLQGSLGCILTMFVKVKRLCFRITVSDILSEFKEFYKEIPGSVIFVNSKPEILDLN